MTVDTHLVSSIGKGVLVFAAVAPEDTRKEVDSMAAKVLKMKLWPDETGVTVRVFNLGAIGSLLMVVYLEVEAKCPRYQGRGPLR